MAIQTSLDLFLESDVFDSFDDDDDNLYLKYGISSHIGALPESRIYNIKYIVAIKNK